ncbi:hypothetical protein ABEV74_17110 [Paenibacillus cisolokensis]|jgi:hypothetical protein|uniref:Uncharacterized protein n=1 Tax=Paenibacillus cisolokensis TaxID=1658519 RepID=A0ABQ4N945_9BACL|nr:MULTISPECIES: hypothetical protein [Paenibacillus]ALS29615.1 hypothetical protein IJ21_42520 [Paenibacillus sp. 32O-W]GIQ64770.1 hypothetical protein PACILC2_33380 [Paenibacillus cisolokensis]
MRALLMTLLLIVTAIVLFTSIAGGESGTKRQLEQAGGAFADSLRRLSP